METPNSAAAERVLTHRACERAGPDCHFFFFFFFHDLFCCYLHNRLLITL